MKKIVRLTESDITNMVKRVINEGAIFDELKGYYSKCKSQSPTPTSKNINNCSKYDNRKDECNKAFNTNKNKNCHYNDCILFLIVLNLK